MTGNPLLTDPPGISIVIPAYNCERFIIETLRSIQAQTFSSWECIIVDDGSSDGTLALICDFAAADPRIRTATQPNSGPSIARNHGLGLIDPRSDYVVFMDSDDLWLPDALRILKDVLDTHPEAVGAHGVGRCINEQGTVYVDPAYTGNGGGRFICDHLGHLIPLNPAAPTTFRSLWFSNPYPPGLILVRRSTFEKAGVFDTSICPMEDWDMMIRLSRYGDFHFVDEIILSYRRHRNNLSVSTSAFVRHEIRAVLHKTFFSPENTPAQASIVRRNWRASELLHLRQNIGALKDYLAGAKFRAFFSALLGSCLHLCRYARGFPTGNKPPSDLSVTRA